MLTCTPRIGEGSAAEGEDAPGFRLPSRGVLLLAILCLLVMVTEGAMADWGGLYLRGDLGTSAAVAALAFAVFSAGMTTGRLFGDWVTGRIGAVATLRWGALLTGIPLAAMLLIGAPVAALLGLFAIGLGVANGVPLMFSAAGPAARHALRARDRRRLLDGLVRLPGRPAVHRRAGRRRLAVVGARHADPRRRRRVRARPARRREPDAEPPETFVAVISDLDGVLIDSSAPTVRSWAAWGDRHGLDGAAIQAGNHGRPARAVIAEHVDPAQVEEEAALLAHAETTDVDGVVAMPGAGDVLSLPRVAIATSCTAPLARARLAAAGLPEPAVLVTSDQVEHGKPAPDPYLLAAERLGVDPAACVVFEDAPAGIASGRAAGMTVWAVTTTHEPGALGEAQRVAGGLPEHLAALRFAERQRRWVGKRFELPRRRVAFGPYVGLTHLGRWATQTPLPQPSLPYPAAVDVRRPYGHRGSSGRRSNDPPSTQCPERYCSGMSG